MGSDNGSSPSILSFPVYYGSKDHLYRRGSSLSILGAVRMPTDSSRSYRPYTAQAVVSNGTVYASGIDREPDMVGDRKEQKVSMTDLPIPAEKYEWKSCSVQHYRNWGQCYGRPALAWNIIYP